MGNTHIATGERVYLKLFDDSMVTDEYIGWLNDPIVTHGLTTKSATRESALDYVRRIEMRRDLMCGVFVKGTDIHIGNITLQWSTPRKSEIDGRPAPWMGTMIGDTRFWGMGYGTEAKSLIIKYALDVLYIGGIMSGHVKTNLASISGNQKLGFQEVLREGPEEVTMLLQREDFKPYEVDWDKNADRIDTRTREKFSFDHNQFKGARLFIMGTGPSLDKVNDHQMEALGNEMVMGVNSLFRYEALPFTPFFYAVAELGWLVSGNNNINVHKEMNEKWKAFQPARRFYCHPFPMHRPAAGSQFEAFRGSYEEQIQDWTYVRQDRDLSVINGDFNGLGDTFDYVPGGVGSVVVFGIMLGCWMGFDEIYLMGCDATARGHAAGLDQGKRLRQDGFIQAAITAEGMMAKAGRKLVNCSEVGDLTIGRQSLKEVLGV